MVSDDLFRLFADSLEKRALEDQHIRNNWAWNLRRTHSEEIERCKPRMH